METRKDIDKSTEKEIVYVMDEVRKWLQVDIKCRNDDKWLLYRVWSSVSAIFIPFADFEKLPAQETVTRCRRRIQNIEKLYPPTDETVVKRRQRQNAFRHIMGGKE